MLCFSSVQGHARKYVWTKRKSRLTVGHRASSVHVPITHVVSFTRSVVFEKQDYLLPLLTGTSIDVIVWGMRMSTICWLHRQICTTKIDGIVCPPNISETVAGRLMKLAHRPRIASTMIKLISKPILLPFFFINFSKHNSAIRRWPEAQIIAAIWFGRLRFQSRSPCPGFGQHAAAIYCALRLPSLGDRDRSPGFG